VAARTARVSRIASLLVALGGVALFVWSMRQAGTPAVFHGVERAGRGIGLVLVLGGVRAFLRTASWRLCLDPADRVPLRSMFAAYLAGDAVGNVTPLGFLISEPSKIVMVRRQIDVKAAVAALTLENLFYSATVVLMLLAGIASLLLFFPLRRPLQMIGVLVLVVTPFVAVAGAWIVATRRRVVSGGIEWLARHGVAPTWLVERLPDIRHTGDRIFGFIGNRPTAVVPLLLLESTYHVAGVAEIWFALGLITSVHPPLLTAFALEAVNRTITTVFQFVPLWLGVDEAGTAAVTSAVNLGSAAGVALALVRKARNVTWTAIGLLIVLQRGMSVGGAAHDADALRPAG
jgi:hypothetical protein